MRVLIVSTSEKTGGAAVAAKRLMEALNNSGVKAKMLVRNKETDDIKVVGLRHSVVQQWHFLWERFCIFCHLHFKRKGLFEIDIANSGNDITRLPEFKEADIIHLHWINQGMLSLHNIKKILDSGKPVVWTMHDMWPATALCHYTRNCSRYKSGGCNCCQLLPDGGGQNDLSAKIWRRKQQMLANNTIHFVACSRWLEGEAKKSLLMNGQSLTSIPNPIDPHIYHPMDKATARREAGLPEDKRVILFASQKVTDHRKGMGYLIEGLEALGKAHREMRENTVVAILGGHADELVDALEFPEIPLGYVSDERKLVSIYNSADVFLLPSLEDNLPNTIMEAMACGVPCVGFNVGGIPEMIDHKKNGYVARYKDENDLAEGLAWTLFEADREQLSKEAVAKVTSRYSQAAVAMKYIEVYNTASAYKHYKLW